jgi:hypothetical protein
MQANVQYDVFYVGHNQRHDMRLCWRELKELPPLRVVVALIRAGQSWVGRPQVEPKCVKRHREPFAAPLM